MHYKAHILEHYVKIAMIMLYALIYATKKKYDIKCCTLDVAFFNTLIFVKNVFIVRFSSSGKLL